MGIGISTSILSVPDHYSCRIFFCDSIVMHVNGGLQSQSTNGSGKCQSVPDGIESGINGSGCVRFRIFLPPNDQRFIKETRSHHMISCDGKGASCRPSGRQFDRGLHQTTRPIDTPHIHVIDSFEMVHVSNDDEVDVIPGQMSVLEGSAHRLMDQLYPIDVESLRFMMSLSRAYHRHSLRHLLFLFPHDPDAVGLTAGSIDTMGQSSFDARNLSLARISPDLERGFCNSNQTCCNDSMGR